MSSGMSRTLREKHWVASGPYWRRRWGPWVLRVGSDTATGRGWMVLRGGEIQGIGHAATLAQAIQGAESERMAATAHPPEAGGQQRHGSSG